jgi:hypothetical protein
MFILPTSAPHQYMFVDAAVSIYRIIDHSTAQALPGISEVARIGNPCLSPPLPRNNRSTRARTTSPAARFSLKLWAKAKKWTSDPEGPRTYEASQTQNCLCRTVLERCLVCTLHSFCVTEFLAACPAFVHFVHTGAVGTKRPACRGCAQNVDDVGQAGRRSCGTHRTQIRRRQTSNYVGRQSATGSYDEPSDLFFPFRCMPHESFSFFRRNGAEIGWMLLCASHEYSSTSGGVCSEWMVPRSPKLTSLFAQPQFKRRRRPTAPSSSIIAVAL